MRATGRLFPIYVSLPEVSGILVPQLGHGRSTPVLAPEWNSNLAVLNALGLGAVHRHVSAIVKCVSGFTTRYTTGGTKAPPLVLIIKIHIPRCHRYYMSNVSSSCSFLNVNSFFRAYTCLSMNP